MNRELHDDLIRLLFKYEGLRDEPVIGEIRRRIHDEGTSRLVAIEGDKEQSDS